MATAIGVNPHLVFRVPLAQDAPIDDLIDRLERTGLSVVSVEPDGAIIAFREEADLRSFRDAISAYERGPEAGKKSTGWDIFEFIEADALTSLQPADRIGPRLADVIGPDQAHLEPDREYTVEVELWHPGSRAQARSHLSELRALIETRGGRYLDDYAGEAICLAKISCSGTALSLILENPLVAEVEFSPTPSLDPREVREVTARDIPPPPRPDEATAARVCVLDSGLTAGHPLLAANVGHEEAVLTGVTDAADQHGHGTMVAGIAVFGDVRQCFERRDFASPILVFSARVLNDRNEFDDERLIVNQMREAVEAFVRAPHNCRVFNLSLGARRGVLEENGGRQSLWAEALDTLAREFKIILVVSAGNRADVLTVHAAEAEYLLTEYPRTLFESDCGVCDPATAALAITVGAYAQEDQPAQREGFGASDIVRGIAPRAHPSPFSRVGPGVNRSYKPEFVAPGGNIVFAGFGGQRRVTRDNGTSVMSFSREPLRALFAFDIGTSLAAPVISRMAAILWQELKSQLGRDPSANLVRALLATSAAIPEPVRSALNAHAPEAAERVCGYGLPDLDLALRSGDRRVTLVAESELRLDHFHVYEVPLPEELRRAPGPKRITIAIAHDPPVRRRRAEYLGVEMHFDLVRGLELDDVIERMKRVAPGETTDPIPQRNRCTLVPSATPRGEGPARKKSTLQKATFSFTNDPANWGDRYYLVIRAEKKRWVPPHVELQTYAAAVVLEGESPLLYNVVRQRIEQRTRVRIR